MSIDDIGRRIDDALQRADEYELNLQDGMGLDFAEAVHLVDHMKAVLVEAGKRIERSAS